MFVLCRQYLRPPWQFGIYALLITMWQNYYCCSSLTHGLRWRRRRRWRVLWFNCEKPTNERRLAPNKKHEHRALHLYSLECNLRLGLTRMSTPGIHTDRFVAFSPLRPTRRPTGRITKIDKFSWWHVTRRCHTHEKSKYWIPNLCFFRRRRRLPVMVPSSFAAYSWAQDYCWCCSECRLVWRGCHQSWASLLLPRSCFPQTNQSNLYGTLLVGAGKLVFPYINGSNQFTSSPTHTHTNESEEKLHDPRHLAVHFYYYYSME